MRVLLAGESRLLRELLGQFLSTQPDLEVIGETARMEEVAEQCHALEPDLALVDARYCWADGVALIRTLARKGLTTRVVLLTGNSTPMRDAQDSGAAACLSENLALGQFVEALRAAARSLPDAGASWQVLTRDSRSRPEPRPMDTLSPRELEVLALLGEGMANREIGDRLFISEFTVKAHLRRIYRKLGISGRAKACLFAAGVINEGNGRRMA